RHPATRPGPDARSPLVDTGGPIALRCRVKNRRLTLEIHAAEGTGPLPEAVSCRVGRHEVRVRMAYHPWLVSSGDHLRMFVRSVATNRFDLPAGHRWRTARWERRDGKPTGNVTCSIEDGHLQALAVGEVTGVQSGVCVARAKDGVEFQMPLTVEVCGQWESIVGTDDPQCPESR
ncbi:MAG: hypothetical protein AAF602_26340, partial [Myxococcota bacterium]